MKNGCYCKENISACVSVETYSFTFTIVLLSLLSSLKVVTYVRLGFGSYSSKTAGIFPMFSIGGMAYIIIKNGFLYYGPMKIYLMNGV